MNMTLGNLHKSTRLPISCGSVLLIRLRSSNKYWSLVKLPNEEGKSQVRPELLATSVVSWPHSAGKELSQLLLDKDSDSRFDRIPKLTGKGPVSLL